MKNMISMLLGLFKKKPVAETPVTVVKEVKNMKPILKPAVEVKPVETPVVNVPQTAAAEPAPIKKKRYYKPKPKKSNG